MESTPPHILETSGRNPEQDRVKQVLTENALLREHNRTLIRDLEVERRRNAQLQAQMRINRRTGLPSHEAFAAWLTATIEQDQARLGRGRGFMRPATQFCLVVVKLDTQFDLISKSFKESASEWMLYQTGLRLKEALESEEHLFHVNDDEFMLILKDAEGPRLHRRLQTITESVNRHHSLAGVRIHLGAHVGVASYPAHGKNHAALVNSANIALSRSIKNKQAFVVFRDAMRRDMVDRMELQNDILKALEAHASSDEDSQFRLVLQPQVHLVSQDGGPRIQRIDAEVLLRWHHPLRGPISPSHFIPLAEETGLIQPLGTWLVHQAADLLVRWKGSRMGDITLSVNVSPRQFLNDQLVHSLDHLVGRHPSIAGRLKLEITESSLLENSGTCLKYMHFLRGLGIQFAIDDFGRDYSNLTYLRKLPIQSIKIDRSFITNIQHSHHDQAIVNAVQRLAEDLHLGLVVEGVETQEQLDQVLDAGCRTIQGYYFSKPLIEGEFESWYLKALVSKD